MNWLFISPCLKSSELKALEDFFYEKEIPSDKISEIFLDRDFSSDELKESLTLIDRASHVVLLSGEFKSSSSAFILGTVFSSCRHVFLLNLHSLENNEMEAFLSSALSVFSENRLKAFNSSEEFLSYFENNFLLYKELEKKSASLKELYLKGIPFTLDCFASAIIKADMELCQLFFDAGIDLNGFTSAGVPLLCVAVREDQIEIARWLIEKGADINAVSKDRGYTPVMDAVWRKNYSLTKYFIEKGASLDSISSDGQSILVLAVGNGDVNIVRILLENGADADIADSMGMSARQYASLFKKTEIMKIMEMFPERTEK